MKKDIIVLTGFVLMLAGLQSGGIAQVPSSSSSSDRFVEIQELKGAVEVKATPQDNWKAAEKGMRVTQDGEIKTGKESTAVLLLDEQGATGKIDVTPNSWLRIAEMTYSGVGDEKVKKTMLDLALGQVLVQAEKLKGESSFQVRTPTSTTSVRGTVFDVKVEEE